MPIFNFSSSDEDTTATDLENSFYNLAKKSKGMQILIEEIVREQTEAGTSVYVKIVDDAVGGRGAKTYPEQGNIYIEVEKNAFDGDYYKSTKNGQTTNHPFTLERFLAEEVAHAYQFAKGAIDLDETDEQKIHDNNVRYEKEAQKIANLIMHEAHGLASEPQADIPEDPVFHPNGYVGSGLPPQIHDTSPHNLQPISYIPDPIPNWIPDGMQPINSVPS